MNDLNVVLTDAERALSRTSRDLGDVFSDAAVERIVSGRLTALHNELSAAWANARTAWDVHAEHVDQANVRLLHEVSVRDQLRTAIDKVREQLAEPWDRLQVEYVEGVMTDVDVVTVDALRAALGVLADPPQTPLPGHTETSAASTSTPLTAGDPARLRPPAGQGTPQHGDQS